MVYFMENPFKKIDDLGVRFWCRCRKLLSGADLRTFQKSGLEPIPIDSIRQASAMSRSSGATRTPFSHITPLSTSPPMFFTAKPGRNGLPGCSLLLDLPNVGRGLAMAWLDAFYMNKRPNMEKNRGFL